MSYIDAHVHVWTDDYDRYPFGAEHNPEGANPKIFLADDILGHARPCGVERVVLVQMSYYQTDNSYMLDVMDEHPGVFSGIGVVDVGDSKPDEEMLRLAQRGAEHERLAADRPLLHLLYNLGWLRQEENQYLSIAPETVGTLSPELQALTGREAHGSLGIFDPRVIPVADG